MARTTVAQVHKAFARILTAIGGEECTDYRDPNRKGKFILDYYPECGGYRIEQYTSNDSYGVTMVFGDRRWSAGDFWDLSWQIVRAFEVAESLRKE